MEGREEEVVLKTGKMIMDLRTRPEREFSGETLLDVKWVTGFLKALVLRNPGS